MSKPKNFAKNFISERRDDLLNQKKVKKKPAKEPKGDRTVINALPPKDKFSKAAPKGVDEAKYKRCKEKVKRQGTAKNPYAVCAAALKKGEKEYPKSSQGVGCGTGTSGKICRRNVSKLNKSEFIKEFKKSYDYRDMKVSVDAKDQQAAEETASKDLVHYIKASLEGDLNKIPFEKGMLTLSRKDAGLYSGFFQDSDGQVIEKFDDQTVEMVAKTMELKELYIIPGAPVTPPSPPATMEVADQIAEAHMDHHNATMHRGPESGSVRIKYGDFELEIKKSIHGFVNDFKKTHFSQFEKQEVKKAVKAWKRNSRIKFQNETEAARVLLENWNTHSEDFYQILHAMRQGNNG